MKIEISRLDRMSLEDFADEYGLTMKVREKLVTKSISGLNPEGPVFRASFYQLEIKIGACLHSAFGSGKTVEEAIGNYAKAISGCKAVIRAGYDREDIKVPLLTYGPEKPKPGAVIPLRNHEILLHEP